MRHIPPFELQRRQGPLLISIPHLGRRIPEELRARYTPEALALEDTDWHLDRLYAFAEAIDATVIQATLSRYVIDLNRPADDESLYPGIVTTSLAPLDTFRGASLYREGLEPEAEEIAKRVERYWKPYHAALKTEIARLREVHGQILLWEAHSIASMLPRLFVGKLPDFCFGTSEGQSCDEAVVAGAVDAIRDSQWSWVVNGRFKGGFITRRYGDPSHGVHALQLEMCQSLYMEEQAPFEWREDLASRVAPVLRACVEGALRQMSAETVRGRTAMLSGQSLPAHEPLGP